jgi:plastocyanin
MTVDKAIKEAQMIRRPHAFALVAGAALVLAGTALARPHASTPTLNGTVGPGYTITLKQNGKAVKSLKAGSYSFVVADKANIHNFVLEKKKGGTFEKELTTVPFSGTKTVQVKLTSGTWEFYCRPHESQMQGTFTVN